MEYLQSEAISTILIEKANLKNWVKDHSNMLIRVAKSIDKKVIGIEVLERWQRIKVHAMLLAPCLEGKMELLWREIKPSTGIVENFTLFADLWDLIGRAPKIMNEERLVIVMMVENSVEAFILCAKGWKFERAQKVIEKYWEAGLSSICINFVGIDHTRLGKCENGNLQYVICAGDYKTQNHLNRVIGCYVEKGKICIHITAKCANCGWHYQAIAFKYLARLKTQMQA